MRTQIRAGIKAENEVAFRFTPPQRDAILSVAELMLSLPISASEFEVQVGGSRHQFERVALRFRQAKDAAELDFSMEDVHLIHSSLLAVRNQFVSEEDFYVRIGFFRDHITGLAHGIVQAIGGLSS